MRLGRPGISETDKRGYEADAHRQHTHDWYGEFGSLSVFDALDEQAQKRITQMQYVQYYLARDALR